MDAMKRWASETQSQIRGLISGNQIIDNRLQAIEEVMHGLATAASESSAETDGIDEVIGYRPTPIQQAELFAALAEWQQGAKTLEKQSTASIQTRAGGTVQYRYADIASVSEIARSAGAHGLAHLHREIWAHGKPAIRTYLLHKAGGWVSCDVPLLTRENTMISGLQQWASACTMARRYGLFLVLGIAAGDEDDDGAMSDGPRRQGGGTSPGTVANQSPGTRPATSKR